MLCSIYINSPLHLKSVNPNFAMLKTRTKWFFNVPKVLKFEGFDSFLIFDRAHYSPHFSRRGFLHHIFSRRFILLAWKVLHFFTTNCWKEMFFTVRWRSLICSGAVIHIVSCFSVALYPILSKQFFHCYYPGKIILTLTREVAWFSSLLLSSRHFIAALIE